MTTSLLPAQPMSRTRPWLVALLSALLMAAIAAPASTARADAFGFGRAHTAVAKKKRKKKRRPSAAEKAAAEKAEADKAAAQKAEAEKAGAERAAAEKAEADKAAAAQAAAEKAEADKAAATPAASAAAPTGGPHQPGAEAPSTGPGPLPAAPEQRQPKVYTPDVDPLWGGFFLSLNVGYATHGGEAGPVIPSPTRADSPHPITINGQLFPQWKQTGCLIAGDICYDKAVRSDVGQGLAVAFQIGYNFFGYASLFADLSWHGSFGSKIDTGGAGTAAVMLGFHPLRFVRADLPVDLKLYGGFGFFEILYYYENQLDVKREAKGKSWMGSSIPFGLAFEARIPDSVFAIGLDLRMVRAAYDKWVYNWDDAIESKLDEPMTTLRFEPRVIFGWHF